MSETLISAWFGALIVARTVSPLRVSESRYVCAPNAGDEALTVQSPRNGAACAALTPVPAWLASRPTIATRHTRAFRIARLLTERDYRRRSGANIGSSCAPEAGSWKPEAGSR